MPAAIPTIIKKDHNITPPKLSKSSKSIKDESSSDSSSDDEPSDEQLADKINPLDNCTDHTKAALKTFIFKKSPEKSKTSSTNIQSISSVIQLASTHTSPIKDSNLTRSSESTSTHTSPIKDSNLIRSSESTSPKSTTPTGSPKLERFSVIFKAPPNPQIFDKLKTLASKQITRPPQPQIINRPQPQIINRPQPQIIIRSQPQIIIEHPQIIINQPQIIITPPPPPEEQPPEVQPPEVQPPEVQQPEVQPPEAYVSFESLRESVIVDPRSPTPIPYASRASQQVQSTSSSSQPIQSSSRESEILYWMKYPKSNAFEPIGYKLDKSESIQSTSSATESIQSKARSFEPIPSTSRSFEPIPSTSRGLIIPPNSSKRKLLMLTSNDGIELYFYSEDPSMMKDGPNYKIKIIKETDQIKDENQRKRFKKG